MARQWRVKNSNFWQSVEGLYEIIVRHLGTIILLDNQQSGEVHYKSSDIRKHKLTYQNQIPGIHITCKWTSEQNQSVIIPAQIIKNVN
jgi:hypothetical protein